MRSEEETEKKLPRGAAPREEEPPCAADAPEAGTAPDGRRFDGSPESLRRKPQERYKLLRTIGFGGMKCVLLVHDLDTGRDIAMALMPDFMERPRESCEQFIREARITAFLEHPNIVPIHDIGLDRNGAPFYTMAYLTGLPLTTILKRLREKQEYERRRYTIDQRLRIFLRICNAVSYAHARNICHLDIKPDNINVGKFGEVRLIDWGLACETDEKGNVLAPRGGKLRGTPGYMAPEQISVNPDAPEAGKHSDIFALGALLYAMITTSVPFQGKNRDDILYKTLTATPARFGEAAPEGFFLPPELEPICFKAMSKDPAARYRSVDELREAVRNVQHNYFVAHLTAGRHRALVSGVILVLFILVAAAAFFLKNFLG